MFYDGTKVQWNRIELPEMDILNMSIYDKCGILNHWGKAVLFSM